MKTWCHAFCVAVFLALLLTACGGEGSGEEVKEVEGGYPNAKKFAKDQGVEAFAPNQRSCPVTGGILDANHHVDRAEGRIWFASEDAVRKFKANPDKYIKNLPKEGISPPPPIGPPPGGRR